MATETDRSRTHQRIVALIGLTPELLTELAQESTTQRQAGDDGYVQRRLIPAAELSRYEWSQLSAAAYDALDRCSHFPFSSIRVRKPFWRFPGSIRVTVNTAPFSPPRAD